MVVTTMIMALCLQTKQTRFCYNMQVLSRILPNRQIVAGSMQNINKRPNKETLESKNSHTLTSTHSSQIVGSTIILTSIGKLIRQVLVFQNSYTHLEALKEWASMSTGLNLPVLTTQIITHNRFSLFTATLYLANGQPPCEISSLLAQRQFIQMGTILIQWAS